MTLDNAAEWIRRGGVQRLRLIGSADRVGAAGPNLRLSRRRAENVRSGLVRRGVPAAALEIVGRGEEGLRVATADGVAEPQNRAVSLEVVTVIPATAAPPAPAASGPSGASISPEGLIEIAEQDWAMCVRAASEALARSAGRAGSGLPAVSSAFEECRRFEDALKSALDARTNQSAGEETTIALERVRSAISDSAASTIIDVYHRNNYE